MDVFVVKDAFNVRDGSTCYYSGFCDLPYAAMQAKRRVDAIFVVILAMWLARFISLEGQWQRALTYNCG